MTGPPTLTDKTPPWSTRWEDSSKLTVPKHSVTIARIPLQ
jgi:hypothetical protein